MKRLRYSVAMSLDGYIAGPQGEADWIIMDPEIDFGAIFSEFDTLLMGRRTFSAAGAMGGSGGGPFGNIKVVVASRTLNPRDYPKVTVISGELGPAVTALKQESGKDIWLFGGGDLCRSLLDLGLVDSIEVAVIPVVLGEGIPLVPPRGTSAPLRLTKHYVFQKTGTVSLAYDVQPPGQKKQKGVSASRRSARSSS
jgi:dihydrofolate reductase